MDNVFGVLRLFMFVNLSRDRIKRVNLATIHCEHSECKAKLEEFRESNFEFGRAIRIHAEFTFTDLIH